MIRTFLQKPCNFFFIRLLTCWEWFLSGSAGLYDKGGSVEGVWKRLGRFWNSGGSKCAWEEEKKKREAEEKKKKEELEKRKAEEAKAAKAAKNAAEKAKREEERRKVEEESRAAEAAKRKAEEIRKKDGNSGARMSPDRKEGKGKVDPLALMVVVGKKRKRVVMVAVPSGDPEDDDPNPGDDGDYNESNDEDDNDPPSTPPKQSRCSHCILKALKCKMVGPGSASCKGCRKAKVRCSLVPDNYPRRSKRVKMESPVASTSSQTINDLRTNIQDLNTRITLQEEMLRYLIVRVRKLEEEKKESEGEDDEEEESEEDGVKRTGDKKGKGRKE
ncbi:hypothetical protein F5890DRAFT_1478851 [Lentinula detonsa]|uniref:Zn(2)-C6 fungal-type domain-containing protein n=1 Tax=Lentinula detonsa TaxID=2804962 RepID=A0AA38PNT0_9AGAR|nr:hypothetical protein F5890DRAFT_1478851 [Lentinula detonsa]